MTTVRTIIQDAYIEARVSDLIDGPTSTEESIGLRWFNRMIGLLSTKNVFIPYTTSENFSITSSSVSYTMGSGGTASSTRARKILNAFIRDSSNWDYPIDIKSQADYNAIADKNISARPTFLFYDPVYPVGVIYFNRKPDQTYTAYIESQKDLMDEATLSTSLSLDREYEEMLVLNLSAKIAKVNGSPRKDELKEEARIALKAIGLQNIAGTVPTAKLPFRQNDNTEVWELFSS